MNFVPHLFRGFTVDHLQQPSDLFTNRVTLAIGHDDSRVAFALNQVLGMKSAKMTGVECVEHTPLRGGILQLCGIVFCGHSCVKHGEDVYSARSSPCTTARAIAPSSTYKRICIKPVSKRTDIPSQVVLLPTFPPRGPALFLPCSRGNMPMPRRLAPMPNVNIAPRFLRGWLLACTKRRLGLP